MSETGPGTSYAAAWPHAVTRWLDRLPVPSPIPYLVLMVITTLLLQLRAWTRGDLPVGTFDANSCYFGFLLGAMLWTFGYLERVAGKAFDAFRPALAPTVIDPEGLRRDLAIPPARPALVATAAALVLTVVTFTVDPASSDVDGVPAWVFGTLFVLQVINVSLLFVLLVHLGRQMLLIRRILAHDAVVDIFRPAPLHAFSGLTARYGIALVVLTGTSVVIAAPVANGGSLVLDWVPYILVPALIAIAAFIVPLYGTHDRLVDEKRRLEAAADARLQALLTELNRDIDARDLGNLAPMNTALTSVLQQREIVAKLSTWPWSTATARGLATAILFPLALFLAQRLVSQLV